MVREELRGKGRGNWRPITLFYEDRGREGCRGETTREGRPDTSRGTATRGGKRGEGRKEAGRVASAGDKEVTPDRKWGGKL